MTELVTVSCTTLNQFALDFEGNHNRILKSIALAKSQGSKFRCGPELEVSGYSCEDHFHEMDTLTHSWEVLAQLLDHQECQGILIDVGMPIMHLGVTYNCRVIFLNRHICLIRPKMVLCDEGNYRETRWFSAWTKRRHIEDYHLPLVVQRVTRQETVPFGDALLRLNNTMIGFEVCEELWVPQSTHIDQSLAGAEIIINGSGSHAEIRKASHALDLIKGATSKCGGVYVFSNLRGCDGQRVYFNGSSSIVMNGKTLRLGEQYSANDVEVLTACVDLTEIRNVRNISRSRALQMAATRSYPAVWVKWSLSSRSIPPTLPLGTEEFCIPEEEIARGPALWLWDYLRRSSASGFFLPLSGGVDSSSVAIIVYSMCHLLVQTVIEKRPGFDVVLGDIRKVLKSSAYIPTDAKSLCGQLLTTCYMGSENSSVETRRRAADLAEAIDSNHINIDISPVVKSFLDEVTSSAFEGKRPVFNATQAEHMALQNIQARSRMVFSYLLAQLGPWSQQKHGFLLVLGSSNVDEAIRGYFTKYDCSAADLNPIGGISKTDLQRFILHASEKFNFPSVKEIVAAPPTAELAPLSTNQTDEEDMGMTYAELATYGKLRLPASCGPFSMVARLLHLWKNKHPPEEISRKVKHFYSSYATNRHKMSTLTPACHMESYGPEDHRYDLRPMFYPNFSWQYRKIDELIESEKQKPFEEEVD